MCGAFRGKNLDEFPNLTIKKIPKTVLTRCEWGRDDYSLEIQDLPLSTPKQPQPTLSAKKTIEGQQSIFEADAPTKSESFSFFAPKKSKRGDKI